MSPFEIVWLGRLGTFFTFTIMIRSLYKQDTRLHTSTSIHDVLLDITHV